MQPMASDVTLKPVSEHEAPASPIAVFRIGPWQIVEMGSDLEDRPQLAGSRVCPTPAVAGENGSESALEMSSVEDDDLI